MTVDELTDLATRWLNNHVQQFSLRRPLFLIPGYDDERGGCWIGPNSLDEWGRKVFQNWDSARRLITFPFPYERPMDSFLDFGDDVRGIIAPNNPDTGGATGEYDLVGHSMGGLDAFAALVDDLDGTRPQPPPGGRLARALNYVTFDAPFGGVPNMPIRRLSAGPSRQLQSDALMKNSSQLSMLAINRSRLAQRAVRATCYGADAAAQVEVEQPDLFGSGNQLADARERLRYRYFVIPGSSHSGDLGITKSVIALANLFETLS